MSRGQVERVNFCLSILLDLLEMGVLSNLTELEFLNYFEALWSKVWCLSMVDHFHFELVNVGKNVVGSYIWWSGDLTSLRG